MRQSWEHCCSAALAEDHFFATDATTAIQACACITVRRGRLHERDGRTTASPAPSARFWTVRRVGSTGTRRSERSMPLSAPSCENELCAPGHRRSGRATATTSSLLRALVVAIQQNKSAVLGFDDATLALNTPHLARRRRERLTPTRSGASTSCAARRRRWAGAGRTRPSRTCRVWADERLAARGLGPDEGRRISGRFGLGADGALHARRRRRDDVRPPRGPPALRPAFDELVGRRTRSGLLFYAFSGPRRPSGPTSRSWSAGLRRRRPRPHLGAREQDAPAPAPRPAGDDRAAALAAQNRRNRGPALVRRFGPSAAAPAVAGAAGAVAGRAAARGLLRPAAPPTRSPRACPAPWRWIPKPTPELWRHAPRR